MIKFYSVLSSNKMNNIHHFYSCLLRVKLFHAKLKKKKKKKKKSCVCYNAPTRQGGKPLH